MEANGLQSAYDRYQSERLTLSPAAWRPRPGPAMLAPGFARDSSLEEDGFEPPVPSWVEYLCFDWFCQLEGWNKPVQKSPPS
jgi:hypothetical protein